MGRQYNIFPRAWTWTPDCGNLHPTRGFPYSSGDKESACNAGFLGWEDPLEEEMTTHSSIIAWRIPWTEEPGRL